MRRGPQRRHAITNVPALMITSADWLLSRCKGFVFRSIKALLLPQPGNLHNRLCQLRRTGGVCAHVYMRESIEGHPALITRSKIGLIRQHGAGPFSSAAPRESGFQLHHEVNQESAG